MNPSKEEEKGDAKSLVETTEVEKKKQEEENTTSPKSPNNNAVEGSSVASNDDATNNKTTKPKSPTTATTTNTTNNTTTSSPSSKVSKTTVATSPPSKKRAASSINAITNDNAAKKDNNAATASPPPPPPVDITKPIKRARTAYFIFSDENRAKIQAQHPGEGVAVVARILGQQWSQMSPEEKESYTLKAAEERERVAKQLEYYKSMGVVTPESNTATNSGGNSETDLNFPVARIRKICKLDPEIKGFSKEAVLLITKCAELSLAKLGSEAARVAQIQNRRTLLPDDVAQVCSTRDQFLFLREDLRDLVRDQLAEKKKSPKENTSAKQQQDSKLKPLTSYFGPKE